MSNTVKDLPHYRLVSACINCKHVADFGCYETALKCELLGLADAPRVGGACICDAYERYSYFKDDDF